MTRNQLRRNLQEQLTPAWHDNKNAWDNLITYADLPIEVRSSETAHQLSLEHTLNCVRLTAITGCVYAAGFGIDNDGRIV